MKITNCTKWARITLSLGNAAKTHTKKKKENTGNLKKIEEVWLNSKKVINFGKKSLVFAWVTKIK